MPLLRDKNDLWQRGQVGPIIETKARPNTVELADIAERHIRQWFDTVPPGAPNRLPVYDDYQWPPRVEILLVDWKSSVRAQKPLQLNFYKFLLDRPNAQAGYHYMDRVRRSNIFQPIGDYPGNAEMLRHVEFTERVKAGINLGQVSFRTGPLCQVCPVKDGAPSKGTEPRSRTCLSRSGRRCWYEPTGPTDMGRQEWEPQRDLAESPRGGSHLYAPKLRMQDLAIGQGFSN